MKPKAFAAPRAMRLVYGCYLPEVYLQSTRAGGREHLALTRAKFRLFCRSYVSHVGMLLCQRQTERTCMGVRRCYWTVAAHDHLCSVSSAGFSRRRVRTDAGSRHAHAPSSACTPNQYHGWDRDSTEHPAANIAKTTAYMIEKAAAGPSRYRRMSGEDDFGGATASLAI